MGQGERGEMKRLVSARLRARIVVLCVAAAAVAVFVATARGEEAFTPDPVEIAPSFVEDAQLPNSQSSAHVSADHVPTPATQAVTAGSGDLSTDFDGLNFIDQRVNADGGNQLSLEPPDQGLCVGNGRVLEAVNDVFAIYNSAGTRQGDLRAFNPFFVGDHAIDRANGNKFGEFMSDPKCYYDPALGRFFMTELGIGRDPTTGALVPPTKLFIAVSKSSSPTTNKSDWYTYSVDTTNNGTSGTPSHPDCPCFGDQPLIGADKYGFYVTTNEFSLDEDGFNGAQIYAFDKAGLANGRLRFQFIGGAPIPLEEGPAYSLQPATSPLASDWATSNNGTAFFSSALEFSHGNVTLDDRIAVWALTNTQSLTTGNPAARLSHATLASQVYGFAPDMIQKDGPTPQGDSVKQKEALVASNDDRMEVAVWHAGQLWSALNTVVKTDQTSTHAGIAYFRVTPSVNAAGQVSGSVTQQGYVASNRNNVAFPAIGVSTNGKVVISYSLVGPDYYPSSAYSIIGASGAGSINVIAAGRFPEDGFTGYSRLSGLPGNVARWGDYGAAAPAADGSIWIASQYIRDQIIPGRLAHWATHVSRIAP
jgi:hypothetical protein